MYRYYLCCFLQSTEVHQRKLSSKSFSSLLFPSIIPSILTMPATHTFGSYHYGRIAFALIPAIPAAMPWLTDWKTQEAGPRFIRRFPLCHRRTRHLRYNLHLRPSFPLYQRRYVWYTVIALLRRENSLDSTVKLERGAICGLLCGATSKGTEQTGTGD